MTHVLIRRCNGCASWIGSCRNRACGSVMRMKIFSARPPRPRTRGEQPLSLHDALPIYDPRLDPTVQWLRKLDWFMQEPGLWIGDANENFLGSLAEAPIGRGHLSNP